MRPAIGLTASIILAWLLTRDATLGGLGSLLLLACVFALVWSAAPVLTNTTKESK